MPLVHVPGSEREASERQRKARKIKPQYAEGRLVKVARANNQPESELIEALLLEEGIPSMSRRSGGFDVPDFLAAGPRDILVPDQALRRRVKRSRPPTQRSAREAELRRPASSLSADRLAGALRP